MTPDLINGCFETAGAIAVGVNAWHLHRDKAVKGVRPLSTAFFVLWAIWNCVFYPAVDLWWSFAGAVLMGIALSVWLIQMLYYRAME